MATSGTSTGRRVVVTGAGVLSPIGIGLDAFWSALLAGTSGIRALPRLAATEMPVRIGGQVSDFDPKLFVKPRKSLKVMSYEIQLGFVAADNAMEVSGLKEHAPDPDRFGVVYGCEMLYCDLDELVDVYQNCIVDEKFDFTRWGDRAMGDMFPLWMLKYLPNMVACHIGIAHDARGPNNTATIGDAASLLGIIEATRVIQRGHADVMLAGGAGSRISLTPWMFRGDAGLSHRSDDPTAASRPFDADRDGMVNSEGAAAIVLESLEHAQARQAPMIAEIVGAGMAFEPPGPSGERTGSAVRHAVSAALAEGELAADQIDHVNAHGLSTVAEDEMEARAIRDTLGAVPVTAPKSYFGNAGSAGGAMELVVSLLALQHGQVPPTLNYTKPDPNCPVEVIAGGPRDLQKEGAVSINFSTTGQAGAIAFRRLENLG